MTPLTGQADSDTQLHYGVNRGDRHEGTPSSGEGCRSTYAAMAQTSPLKRG
jgi:hypothetical protein